MAWFRKSDAIIPALDLHLVEYATSVDQPPGIGWIQGDAVPEPQKLVWDDGLARPREMTTEEVTAIETYEATKSAESSAAAVEIKTFTGWSTYTADEAAQYVQDNVTDIASAVVVMKKMAKLLCWLRDFGRLRGDV